MSLEIKYNYLASFDIGYKNFAFSIEKVNMNQLQKIKNISKSKRYLINGLPTKEFENILKEVYLSGEIIVEENIDLSKGEKDFDINKICISMNNTLDKYKIYFDDCEAFVIEKQMSFGRKKNNIKALKLGQNCQSYFLFNYHTYKTVVEFPSYNKTKVLGAPKKMTKPERKKWSSNIYIDILELRNDQKSLFKQIKRKKKDDVADTSVQLQAFKYMVYVDKNINF